MPSPKTRQSNYEAIRGGIKVGDSLAFVGRSGLYSRLIRTFTGRPTHFAPVAWIEEGGDNRVKLIEALEGKGVIMTYASERIAEYNGEVYLMRFNGSIPHNPARISLYLEDQIGKPYALTEALLSGPGQWFQIPGTDRSNSLFCSELDWQSKRWGGGVSEEFMGFDRTPTPRQMAQLPIWLEFVQLKGEYKPL